MKANVNNNNVEYLERLTRIGPKRLHVLYKDIFVKIQCVQYECTHAHRLANSRTRAHANTHTHTHTHARTHAHTYTHSHTRARARTHAGRPGMGGGGGGVLAHT